MSTADFDGVNLKKNTVISPNRMQRERATFSGQLDPVVKNQYSLAIFDLGSNFVLATGADELDPAGRFLKAEYFFSVPPKVYEIGEPFSTTVIPTQNGGKYVESHGSIMKDVKLQGTTGLRPNPHRRSIENIPLIGSAASHLADQADTLTSGFGDILQRDTGLIDKEALGYDDIIFLRNIFRRYSDLKETGRSSRIVMLWRNAKDADYWIVEPLDFRLQQSSASPLTYNYTISLKVLSRFTTDVDFPEDPLAAILATRRLFSRVQEYNQAIRKTFSIVSGQINRLAGLGVFATSSVLNPLLSIAQGINQVKSAATEFDDTVKQHATNLFDNVEEELKKIKGEVNPDSPYVDPNPNKVDSQEDFINALRKILKLLARISTEPSFNDTTDDKANRKKNQISNSYNRGGTTLDARQAPSTGGSTTFIGNQPTSSAVEQAVVHEGDDIRTLAGRLLGDRGRWHILAVLNDLKSPYITPTGSADTLKPGDAILYPSDKDISTSTVNSVNSSNLESEGDDQQELGPVQHAYGRDIRLKSVTAGAHGVNYTDFAINQRGDISTIVGVPNVNQAVRIKFATEQGELPIHPKFGAKFPIGSKGTEGSANEFQINAESTLYSDYRVESINSLEFSIISDAVVVSANLKLINSSNTLNTSIALRRF